MHLILDEFGFPATLSATIPSEHPAHRIPKHYEAVGFSFETLRADSRYTTGSLSTLLGPRDGQPNVIEGGANNALWTNRYVDGLIAAGYDVTVWQTTYLDFCTDPERITCWSSNPFDGRVFSEFSMVDRLRLTLLSVASTYQTEFNYRHMPAAAWVQRNLGIPGKNHRILSYPISQMQVWRQPTAEIRAAEPGDAFFAHILLPHHPFVFDGNC